MIVNRVAQSGIITINLEKFYPQHEIILFDIKEFLFMKLILKEKDFRQSLKDLDWTVYQDKNVAITCTTDAIIPKWAYMLIVSYLQPLANDISFGTTAEMNNFLFQSEIRKSIQPEDYRDKRVVIKGCGEKDIPTVAYVEITRLLKPVVKSLMYGEPCSTVPIYKQPRVPKKQV